MTYFIQYYLSFVPYKYVLHYGINIISTDQPILYDLMAIHCKT